MQAVAVAVVMLLRKEWAAVAGAVMARGRLCQPTQLQALQTKAAAVVALAILMAVMCQQTVAAVW